MKRLWDDDELTTEWTLEPSDQPLLANKTGATRLGFAALLTFFRHEGRFPASKHEVPAAVVAHLARQVGVPAEAYVAYDWRGRTIKYHRVQIRTAHRRGRLTRPRARPSRPPATPATLHFLTGMLGLGQQVRHRRRRIVSDRTAMF